MCDDMSTPPQRSSPFQSPIVIVGGVALIALIAAELWQIYDRARPRQLVNVDLSPYVPQLPNPEFEVSTKGWKTDLEFSPNGELLAAALSEGAGPERVSTQIYRISARKSMSERDALVTLPNCGKRCVWSSDGSVLAVQCTKPPGVQIHDTGTWTPRKFLRPPEKPPNSEFEVRSLAYDSRGNLFATLQNDWLNQEVCRPVVWWNSQQKQENVPDFIGREGHLTGVSIDAHAVGNDIRIAISYEDGLEILQVRQTAEGEVRVLETEFDPQIKDARVRFVDQAHYLAVVNDDGFLLLRFNEGKKEIVVSHQPAAIVRGDDAHTPMSFYSEDALAASRDGRFVACTPIHSITQVWRIGEVKPRFQWWAQGALSLSPDGSLVAFSGRGGAIKFYPVPEWKN